MFEWKEDYSLGNGAIDEQHQRLFQLGGQIHDLLKNKRNEDKFDDLVTLINELRDYTVYHFEFEEGMMEAAGYPNLDLHEQEHCKFIDKLNTFSEQDLDAFQNKVVFEMLGFVADWIERHILHTDAQYKGYV